MDPRGLKREGRDSLGLQYLERVPGVACWRSRSSEGVLVLAGVLALFLSFFRCCHGKEAEGGAERSGRKIDVDVVPCMGNRGGGPPCAAMRIQKIGIHRSLAASHTLLRSSGSMSMQRMSLSTLSWPAFKIGRLCQLLR